MNPFPRIRRLFRMVFQKNATRLWTFARSNINWYSEVGDTTSSSTVMAPILWTCRTFPEAPPTLWQKLDNGQEELVWDHPLLRLMQRPNPFFTGPELWMATLADWMIDGNAYWLKIRSRANEVAELWWVPTWMIEPGSDDTTFISQYTYSPGYSEPIGLSPADVVHFRFGADPQDPRKGYAPLKSVLREVFTDDEAVALTATLLRNLGVPGLVVSPGKELSTPPSDEDLDEMKAYLDAQFTGDRRGKPMAMKMPVNVEQFGFSPEQMLLRELRRIPEERVTAVLGVPAIVAGLGAGLDRSTFTNMAEAREAAYESGIIPTQRIIAERIRLHLLTDFEGKDGIWDWRFGFDLSKVRVLQEDLYRQAQRHDLAIRGGWAMVEEGRRPMGLEVVESRDRVFLRQANVTEVDGTDGRIRSYAPRGGSGNGTAATAGHESADEIADAVVRAFERDGLRAARTAS